MSTPAPFADASDVQDAWRPLGAQETSVANVLCRYASALLRSKLPDLDARLDSDALDDDLPRLVVVDVVKRALRNPEGQRSDTTGPFSSTWDPDLASGRITITDEDLAQLTPASRSSRRRFGSIRVRPGLL